MKASLIDVAAYLRMSSDQQDKSIDDQRTEVTAYAAKHGYRIVAWYIDEALSGWKSKERRGFQSLIADAPSGQFKGVLCWDQARFSRFDPMEANYYWFILKREGAFLETVCEGRLDWDSLGGWLTASVQQHGKAEYVRSLARDSTRGRRAAIMAGRWITSAPYGYKLENGKLTLGDAAAVATIRRIFELRANGWGQPAIAAALNNDRVPVPRGHGWYARQVGVMLRRQTYCGDTVIGEWSRAKFCRVTEEVVVLKDTHPAIIDRETWDRVQRINRARENAHPSRNGRKPGGPLSGLVICAKCGRAMFYEKRYDRYICSTNYTGNGCTCNAISNAVALRIVADRIRDHILKGSQKALAEYIAKSRGSARHRPVAMDIGRQLADVDRKLATAADRLLEVEPELFASVQQAMKKLQERREVLAAQLAAAKVERKERSAAATAARLWQFFEMLLQGDVITVRTALSQMVDRMELEFEQSTTNRRQWLPVRGVLIFLPDPIAGLPPTSHSSGWVPKKAVLRRKDFEG